MTTNTDVAEVFRTVADLLDLLGEKFKPEAYRRAARSIESLTENIADVAKRGELHSIPGVGDAIAEKTEEYLRTGSISYYERLKREVPPGLVELMRIPGLGPKTARRFWVELGVEGPAELREAIAAGRLNGLKGFGERKIEQLRSALADTAAGAHARRRPIEEVYTVAFALVRAVRERAEVDRMEVAGSFRRARESVGDLDLLATSKNPPTVFDAFTADPHVGEVVMRGDTKETVILKDGLQVDLRVVAPAEFGAALVYFTGSKDHNIHLRSLARDLGLKVNEYGVFRGDESVAGATEEDVYRALGLAWIPPELREDRGEIEAAARGPLPPLVGAPDLRGDLHVHLADDGGPAGVDRIVADGRVRGYAYIGFVVGGVRADGKVWTLPASSRSRIAGASRSDLRLLRAVETGPESVPDELAGVEHDLRIVRPVETAADGGGRSSDDTPMRLVAHVGSSVAPEASALAAWIERARTSGAAIEVGPGPERLDSVAARKARDAGVPLHLPVGLGGGPEDPTGYVALGFARRAATGPEAVMNAGPVDRLRTGAAEERASRTVRSSGRPKGRSGRRSA